MNKAVLMGRLTRDPEVRYTAGENTAVARYTIAVDRRYKQEGQQQADFIPCVAFGKAGEFAGKYFHKGGRVIISGRIQTGSYTNREGRKIYTTEIVVEEQEFAENRREGQQEAQEQPGQSVDRDGFMNIPDGIEESLPFN